MTGDVDHGARAHATWSASSTAANWACPGRLSMVAGAIDKESRAAAWGTACHQISETCLRDGQDAVSFVGRIVKTKEHEFEVDEEMAECAQEYVDYVRKAADGTWTGKDCERCGGTGEDVEARACAGCGGTGEVYASGKMHIEQHFSLWPLDPPFDAGGTCDAIVYRARAKEKEVVDLKAGRGVVVEAKGNPQLRTYALGAMLANPGLDVERITVTIVQPRAAHKDGRIRSETFHVADLIEWTSDLLAAMHKSKAAMDARTKMDDALWADSFLRAGDHCKFCPAAATCPAMEKLALGAAAAWLTPEGVLEVPASDVQIMDGPRVAAILDKADLLEDWLNAVRARGQWLVESGIDVPGYQLVDKQARRKWIDENAAREQLVDLMGFKPETINSPKLLSPAQMEKVIGKAKFADLAAHIDKSSSGQNLVASAKTQRPAALSPAAKFLTPVT